MCIIITTRPSFLVSDLRTGTLLMVLSGTNPRPWVCKVLGCAQSSEEETRANTTDISGLYHPESKPRDRQLAVSKQ